MKIHVQIIIAVFYFHLFIFSTSSNPHNFPSIHDLLKSKGLPGGLFPSTVKSFSVDQNGQLEIWFDQPCLARFEGEVRFDRVVRGNLSYGGISGVEGFHQMELFLWFNVRGILVTDPSSGVILFDLGVAQKQLPLSLFEDPPTCKPQNQRLGLKNKGFEDQR